MIRSFGSQLTLEIWQGHVPRGIHPDVARAARRRLLLVDAAHDLRDLAAVGGHRLESLRGPWSGWWSLRVNQQWRLCFRWSAPDAVDVMLVDYH